MLTRRALESGEETDLKILRAQLAHVVIKLKIYSAEVNPLKIVGIQILSRGL